MIFFTVAQLLAKLFSCGLSVFGKISLLNDMVLLKHTSIDDCIAEIRCVITDMASYFYRIVNNKPLAHATLTSNM